jgi:hypothetical protein
VSCTKYVVIPRATERILPAGNLLPSVNWEVLEYLAFESNARLIAIKVDDLFCCSSLRSLFIPAFVQDISGMGFFGTNISMIFVDSENGHLMVRDFYLMDFAGISILRYCGFESDLTLDTAVEIIGVASFAGCESLSSFLFQSESRLTRIDTHAFFCCSSLQSICLPDSVRVLGKSCFCHCISLSTLTLSSVTRIDSRAFCGCISLQSVCVPASVAILGDDCF